MPTDAVLIINTGGTIGMVREDPHDPLSPLRPGTWDEITRHHAVLRELPFATEVHTFPELLDSADMTHANWVEIATVIGDRYDRYTGFVILHGTDTMAFTASALSFMLRDLGKPVVLTGAQIPMVQPRSDAVHNLVTALQVAAHRSSGIPLVPEVCIFFDDRLLRGNRTRKLSSTGYSAFDSPNMPPLGTVGENIVIDTKLILPLPDPTKGQVFHLETEFDTNVMALDLFPGLRPAILRSLLATPDPENGNIKGLVLKTFGSGSAPSSLTPSGRAFLDAISDIHHRAIIVNVTQCPQGTVRHGSYTSRMDLEMRGAVSGRDLTPEAALCKLMWLLGKGIGRPEVERLFQLSHAGEQSSELHQIHCSGVVEVDPIFTCDLVIPEDIVWERLQKATLLFRDLTTGNAAVPIALGFRIDHTPEDGGGTTSLTPRRYRSRHANRSSTSIDATDLVRRLLAPGETGRLSIETDLERLSWQHLTLTLLIGA